MKGKGRDSAAENSECTSSEDQAVNQQMYPNFRVVNAEGGHVTLSQSHFDDLHAALQKMQLVVDESSATMKQYQKDMESMRKVEANYF